MAIRHHGGAEKVPVGKSEAGALNNKTPFESGALFFSVSQSLRSFLRVTKRRPVSAKGLNESARKGILRWQGTMQETDQTHQNSLKRPAKFKSDLERGG